MLFLLSTYHRFIIDHINICVKIVKYFVTKFITNYFITWGCSPSISHVFICTIILEEQL